MFKPNKALLSILILSGLTIQTTQPFSLWSLIANRAVWESIRTGAAQALGAVVATTAYEKYIAPHGSKLLEKAKEHKYLIAGSIAIGAVMLYAKKKYNDNKQEECKRKQPLNDKLREELNAIATQQDKQPNWELIQELITNGADANTASEKLRWVALHFAVIYKNIEMVRFLLQHKALSLKQNVKNKSPLALAEQLKDSDPQKKELVGLLKGTIRPEA